MNNIPCPNQQQHNTHIKLCSRVFYSLRQPFGYFLPIKWGGKTLLARPGRRTFAQLINIEEVIQKVSYKKTGKSSDLRTLYPRISTPKSFKTHNWNSFPIHPITHVPTCICPSPTTLVPNSHFTFYFYSICCILFYFSFQTMYVILP